MMATNDIQEIILSLSLDDKGMKERIKEIQKKYSKDLTLDIKPDLKKLESGIQSFEARYALYKELVEKKIDDGIAVKIAFGFDYPADGDTKEMLANYIKEFAEKENLELIFDIQDYGETIREQLGEVFTLLPENIRGYVEELDRMREAETAGVTKMYTEIIQKTESKEAKCLDIIKKYEEKIAEAYLIGDKAQARALEKERDKQLLRETLDGYNELFSSIGKSSLSTALEVQQNLMDMLKSALESGKLTADQYKMLMNDVQGGIGNKVTENPLASVFNISGDNKVGNAITSYLNGGTDGLSKTLSSMGGEASNFASKMNLVLAIVAAIDKQVKNTFNAMISVTSAGKSMQDALGNESSALKWEHANNVIKAFSDNYNAVFKSFKDGDIMGSLAATVTLPMKLVESFAVFHDKKLAKTIKDSKNELKGLVNLYSELEWTIGKALGSAKYTGTKDQIENLKQQEIELNKQLNAEQSKKKKDDGAIKDFEKQLQDVQHKMVDVVDAVRKDILGGSIGDIADKLGNAFLDAFAKGEDGAKAFSKEVDSLVQGIIKKMLLTKMIEEPIGKILDKYSQQWIDDEGNFANPDEIMKSATQMGDELKNFGSGLGTIMENLPEEVKKYFLSGTESSENKGKTISNAIAGITEDTANLLGSYMNAIRADVSVMRINFDVLNPLVTNIDGVLAESLSTQMEISANTLKSALAVERLVDIFDGVTNPVGVKKMNIR